MWHDDEFILIKFKQTVKTVLNENISQISHGLNHGLMFKPWAICETVNFQQMVSTISIWID